jgi:hypothetical protein
VPAGQAGARATEGAFYVWTDEEVGRLLGGDADPFRHRFGVRPGGNAPHDPHGEFAGRNLLYEAQPLDRVANLTGRSRDEADAAIGRGLRVLFEARLGRPRPHRDDKVLAGWNGLMIGAFARAARVLEPGWAGRAFDHHGYLQAARRAAGFLRRVMWDADRHVLRRRYRAREAAIDAYAEDYAALVFGLIELVQADGDPVWLEWALALQRRQDELFWDGEHGGWFSTTGQDASVILRLKDEQDGAEPSASSLGVLNLLVLAHLTGEAPLFRKVDRTLQQSGAGTAQSARAVPMMMAALSAYRAGLRQVVIVGPPGRDDTRDLRRAVAASYDPFRIVVPVDPEAHQARLSRILPFIGSMSMIDGRATAYVCRDFTCRQPVTGADDLRLQLAATA